MATTGNSGGGTAWDSAKQFAVDRLKEETESLSPSELAGEYGCSGDHMRHCLSELAKDELVERIGHGEYMAGEQAGEHVLQQEDRTNSHEEDSPENTGNTGDIGPSADGPAPSEDPDMTGQNPAVDEEERADMTGVDDEDREEIEDETVTVRSWSTGSYIVAGSVLLVLAVLWLSLREESETEPEQPVEDEPDDTGDSPNVADWGAE